MYTCVRFYFFNYTVYFFAENWYLKLKARLEFEWKTVNNTVDCGVFVMRHMETWFGVTTDKWDSGFPLSHKETKACLTRLRKKYAIKLVKSEANKHRSRVLAEAAQYEKANGFGCV
ncbi:hypothetical protein Hanom_Chr07g00659381 [Helianthus anomalus]